MASSQTHCPRRVSPQPTLSSQQVVPEAAPSPPHQGDPPAATLMVSKARSAPGEEGLYTRPGCAEQAQDNLLTGCSWDSGATALSRRQELLSVFFSERVCWEPSRLAPLRSLARPILALSSPDTPPHFAPASGILVGRLWCSVPSL